jgi:hypothetical protein
VAVGIQPANRDSVYVFEVMKGTKLIAVLRCTALPLPNRTVVATEYLALRR